MAFWSSDDSHLMKKYAALTFAVESKSEEKPKQSHVEKEIAILAYNDISKNTIQKIKILKKNFFLLFL